MEVRFILKLRFVQLTKNIWSDPRIRKMQEPVNGAIMLVIYLKMLTESISNNGVIIYNPAFESIGEQISLALGDETEANIMMTISFCIGLGLIKIEDNNTKFIFCDFPELTSGRGKQNQKVLKKNKELSQTKGAIKQRAYRLRLKQKSKIKNMMEDIKIERA